MIALLVFSMGKIMYDLDIEKVEEGWKSNLNIPAESYIGWTLKQDNPVEGRKEIKVGSTDDGRMWKHGNGNLRYIRKDLKDGKTARTCRMDGGMKDGKRNTSCRTNGKMTKTCRTNGSMKVKKSWRIS